MEALNRRWTVRASMLIGWRSEAAGHPVVARIHLFGADGDWAAAYHDTAAKLGFLVEAVEPPARMPAPDFTM